MKAWREKVGVYLIKKAFSEALLERRIGSQFCKMGGDPIRLLMLLAGT